VAQSWEHSRNVGDFLMKRVRRVYPAFVVVMLLEAFVIAPAFSTVYRTYTAKQLLQLSLEVVDLVGYGFPYGGLLEPFASNPFPHEINGSLWTIRYEFVCYVLLAVLASVGLMKHRRWLLAIACFFVGMTLLTATGTLHVPWSKVLTATFGVQEPLFCFAGFFFSGVAFYLYRKSLRFPPLLVLAAVVLSMGALVGKHAGHLLFPIAGVYLVVGFAVQQRVRLAWLVNRADISYGFYLYAFPIQQILVSLSRNRIGPTALFALAVPLTAGAATLSWYGIERPFLKRRNAIVTMTERVGTNG
jgi:peptidoglycan/LPS O-acetylase OafA/YrhL